MAKGAPPLWDPRPLPRGKGLSARRLAKFVGAVWNRTHQNVEVYGRSEDETPRKCILQAEKHNAWHKKTLRRTFVSLGKIVFSPFGRKKQPFFLRKQKFASEFFCTWHNVSSQEEHIFFTMFSIFRGLSEIFRISLGSRRSRWQLLRYFSSQFKTSELKHFPPNFGFWFKKL